MSANFCYSLLKDSRGLIWIGTSNGLSRYDGYHFYNFKSGIGNVPFINNRIIDLCEDKQGNIWGAAASGIFCYLVKKDSLVNYIPPTLDFSRQVNNIVCDKKGNIWATTALSIVKLNRQKNTFEEIEPLSAHKDSLGFYRVRQNGLIEDPSGKGLWLATRKGLHFYNTGEGKFYGYRNQPGDPLFTDHSVAALSLSASGNYFFFDNITKDIISFDPATRKILLRLNVGAFFSDAAGQALFEDSNHRLWFSTWSGEMMVIDYQKNIFTPIAYKNDNPLSIAGDGFWDVWEDGDKNIWLATAGGIAKCNYSKNAYSIVPIAGVIPEFKNSRLGGFSIDPLDKSWWIASEGTVSVIQYYPGTGRYNYFDLSKAGKNSKGEMPGPVFTVNFIDGQPYACTHTGVWQLNRATRQAIPFEKKFDGLPSLAYNYLDQQGDEIWFTTKEGYIKWNKHSGKAILIKTPVDSLPDGQRVTYSRITFDKTGKPWFVPGFGWLASVNEKNEVLMKYYIKNKAKELSGYLTSIIADDNNNLWMAGTGVGLYKYDIGKDEIKLLDQSDGITSFISQTAMDKEGRLWIAATNKFSVFNPGTKSIANFNLPVYENTLDYSNVLVADSSGVMLSTLNKDMVVFMPDRVSLKPALTEPLVSMIKISGKDKLITNENDLRLAPYENSLEFSFGSLISAEIFPYSFEYRLDGFDKSWLVAGTGATALYNNLEPGKYTFRVKAVAKDKTWQTPEKIIRLTIRTPFYKARWFWLLVSALLIAALFLFYRFRLNKQKQILLLQTKAQQLEKEKTIVMYDSLKQQLNPHFLFNSLTSLSGLIETDQKEAGSFLEQMSGIYRYILKNGDSGTVSLKDELEFARLYIDLQQTRFKKGLQVNINVPDDYLHYKIAPVTLQSLIENAIKHNIIDTGSPLVIDIFISGDYLVVKNNLQKKSLVETSNKKGLQQFVSLYRYLTDLPVIIKETNEHFEIQVPLF